MSCCLSCCPHSLLLPSLLSFTTSARIYTFTTLTTLSPSTSPQLPTQPCRLQPSQSSLSLTSTLFLANQASNMNPAQVPKDARSQSFLPKGSQRKSMANVTITSKTRPRKMRKLRDNILGISMSSSLPSFPSYLMQYDMICCCTLPACAVETDKLTHSFLPSSAGYSVCIHVPAQRLS